MMQLFSQDDDRVDVTTRNIATNTDSSTACRYPIGADGARSPVRKQSRIGFHGVTDCSIVDRRARRSDGPTRAGRAGSAGPGTC